MLPRKMSFIDMEEPELDRMLGEMDIKELLGGIESPNKNTRDNHSTEWEAPQEKSDGAFSHLAHYRRHSYAI